MQSIYDFTLEELKEKLKPSFRAKQVYNWLYKKYASSFEEMKNLPKDLIEELKQNYTIDVMQIIKKEKSIDGSIKYLFRLHDGVTVEAVLLLMKKKKIAEDGTIERSEKYTVCISSQVGCKVGCSFCLTAKGGFVRNLTVGEYIAQIVNIKRDNEIPENKSLNIVYMGMGEPLDNYNNFVKAVKIFSELDGLAISRRRQTVSTSGISTKIEKLGKEDLGIQLAISLHAVDDELRSELIPMNKAYNIKTIIDAVRKFPIDTRKKVMFEYLVIKDKNDDIKSADNLVKLLNGINAKVNLIYFNPYPGTTYQRPESKDMVKFQEYLLSKGLLCTIRESKGLDISAACGQLKEKEANGST
ncbi:23S rRNA (adenine(2503)-C(2))-methyltransferase RlmN [Malaciobacter mytili]|uniref:Probable dual-specificity RNA methyltransferase RlmN n=1 Tax=Malaciobacter mytili LMG 24559 TaxID=1032238 RepID=A0AAX2AJZ6_9BACT|nr:23S rRNA (adenine(2503)-C(2))-methyltransferase RlmN [Malaciobacter mytili]AXH13676.1 23S rRNA m2A2503 methyltransferase / tRNA m2A37 methyltransferase [Malaciobacter mytili LMG 24559]RXK16288.1 23S rRNA (adenine(2503)-C(2))-methyltransferase RlmN [Malaciobacter mytili LMG 24559]